MNQNEMNNLFQRVSRTLLPALIMFSMAMLIHTFFLIIVKASLPNKLPQILLALSTTLLNDSALLIDLVRDVHFIPPAYSTMDILALGLIPWFIAGIFRVNTPENTKNILKYSFYGVLLSMLVFFYLWLVIGGVSFIGVFFSFQFITGAIVSIVLSGIGGILGIKLRKWVQTLSIR